MLPKGKITITYCSVCSMCTCERQQLCVPRGTGEFRLITYTAARGRIQIKVHIIFQYPPVWKQWNTVGLMPKSDEKSNTENETGRNLAASRSSRGPTAVELRIPRPQNLTRHTQGFCCQAQGWGNREELKPRAIFSSGLEVSAHV